MWKSSAAHLDRALNYVASLLTLVDACLSVTMLDRLPNVVIRIVDAFVLGPLQLIAFLLNNTGHRRQIGFGGKLSLISKICCNSRSPDSMSLFMEQLVLADALLTVSPDIPGDAAEFGSYRGMSTASLSLACALAHRNLFVFDSFWGLPEPEDAVTNIAGGTLLNYKAGDYAGSLQEVRRNVATHVDLTCVISFLGTSSRRYPMLLLISVMCSFSKLLIYRLRCAQYLSAFGEGCSLIVD